MAILSLPPMIPQPALLIGVVTVGENLITIECVCLGGKRAPRVCKNMILQSDLRDRLAATERTTH